MGDVKKCKHGRNFCCECHMAHEALKPENQRIYPVGTTRDYESELAALREELAEVRKTLREECGLKLKAQQRLTAAEQRNTFRDRDAGRYRKLQLWMASNVKEGWAEVEKMGGICAWMSCDDMDEYLDRLPDCNVGLCEKPTESGASDDQS